MGLRGQAPRPTPLKLLAGVDKVHPERVNLAEPVVPDDPDADLSVPPDELEDDEARDLWAKTAPICLAMGTLTSADREAFAGYCAAAALQRRAYRECAGAEVIEVELHTGVRKLIRNPWFDVWTQAFTQQLRAGARFGLTPSDRSSIRMPESAARKSDVAAAEALLS